MMDQHAPTRVHDLEGARARYGELADRVVAHLWVGDPPADAAVDALATLSPAEGRGLVDALLAGRSVQAPEPLAALVAACRTDPPWLDRARVEHGARTYRRLGLGAVAILASVSLLRGYHSSAVNKPLVFAQRLQSSARIRLGETGRFIYDVSARGGLEQAGPGFRSSVRVRLMHATVRRRLEDSERWDREAWGVPINQADLCATGVSFSIAVLVAAREMGFRFTRRESEDLLHLWRYVSWLMGTPDTLLWSTEDEARQIGELVGSLQPGADDWSMRLSDALRSAMAEVEGEVGPWRPAFRMWRRYLDALARELNGDAIADDLGIPPAPPLPVLPLTRWVVGPIERTRRWMPGGSRLLAVAGHRILRHATEQMLQDHHPRYDRPADLPGLHTAEAVPEPKPAPPPFVGALYRYRRRA